MVGEFKNKIEMQRQPYEDEEDEFGLPGSSNHTPCFSTHRFTGQQDERYSCHTIW
jgi:hypothetical protein